MSIQLVDVARTERQLLKTTWDASQVIERRLPEGKFCSVA